MSLDKNKLILEIRKINDASSNIHEGFPDNVIEASNRWSSAISIFCEDMSPPSSSLELARLSLESILLTVPLLGEVAFTNGLISFAAILSTGMLPNFTPTVPLMPPILTPAFSIGMSGGSAEEVAVEMSNIIFDWLTTGTAINTLTSQVINWN